MLKYAMQPFVFVRPIRWCRGIHSDPVADRETRTLTTWLEARDSTIELYPQQPDIICYALLLICWRILKSGSLLP